MLQSLPSWERGLKFKYSASSTRPLSVAPLVGAWIEIEQFGLTKGNKLSLPSWERGLKSRETLWE